MKKFMILLIFVITMIPIKPGIGTQLRKAVYSIDLLKSPDGQLHKISPSIVKSLMNQEIGSMSSQPNRKKIHEGLTKLTQNCHKYFPEFCYAEPKCHEIQINLGSPITAITELQDGRLVCGSEKGVLKIIAPPGKVCTEIEFDGIAINGIIELHCPGYSGYIAVLLPCGIALINPDNFGYTIFEADENILDNFSLIGFQELKNGALQGMILILLDNGLIVFDPFKKEFFPRIDHNLLNNFIEKTFFENAIGNLFFITQNLNAIKCLLYSDSEIINMNINEIPTLTSHANKFNGVYRYLLNKKGVIAFSQNQNDDPILREIGLPKNNLFASYRGHCPATLTNAQGTVRNIIHLKNNSQCACLISILGSSRFLKLFYSPYMTQEFNFSHQEGATEITELKEGNLAIGLGNGNIAICTLYYPNLKNLSVHQIALLVHLINFEKRCQEDRPEWAPTFHLHPGWHNIFTTLPEVYQNRFKDMIATVDHSLESSLLSKNSHPNPSKQNQDAKRTFRDEPTN